MDIRVQDLYFTYPGEIQALAGVSLVVEAAEKVAIVGQNGSGKTSLVKHFNGLLQPGRGRVLIGDWDTRQKSVAALASRVGYVFQNPDEQLFARTVVKEVAFGPLNLGFPTDRRDALVAEALSLTGLEADQDANPYDLSPTRRKLLALASVLAMDTPILVLDEPTTGQDTVTAGRISALIHNLAARGKTVIAISHDLDFCAENFDRLVVMDQGRITLDGPLREVIARPEILAETAVEPPQMARLSASLGLVRPAITPQDFIDLLRQRAAPGRQGEPRLPSDGEI